MIWFFTRDHAHIDLEVHRLPQGQGYMFAVTKPDGSEQVERFTDAGRLVSRVLSVQRGLLEEGWTPASPAGGRVAVRVPARPRPRGRYLVLARRAVGRVRRSLARRLAALLG